MVGDPPSVITIEADDGTLITLRRFVELTPNGDVVNSFSVEITATGEQYFSSLLRDAPQITRVSTSVISNCGAVCNSDFEIFPPFAGFNASGRGDGFSPLLFNKDGVRFNGFEEIWAVNHHIDNADGRNIPGSIICMDAETQQACLGGTNQFDLDAHYPTSAAPNNNLQTANRALEYIDSERGIILFVARDAGLDRSGIACWDARERQFCETAFIGLFDAATGPDDGGNWANFLNVNGPWVFGDKVYAIAQDGTWGCATLTDGGGNTTLAADCGSGDTAAAAGLANLPDINDNRWFIVGGKQFELGGEADRRLIVRQPLTNNNFAWSCLDLENGSSCWAGPGYVTTNSVQYLSLIHI